MVSTQKVITDPSPRKPPSVYPKIAGDLPSNKEGVSIWISHSCHQGVLKISGLATAQPIIVEIMLLEIPSSLVKAVETIAINSNTIVG